MLENKKDGVTKQQTGRTQEQRGREVIIDPSLPPNDALAHTISPLESQARGAPTTTRHITWPQQHSGLCQQYPLLIIGGLIYGKGRI